MLLYQDHVQISNVSLIFAQDQLTVLRRRKKIIGLHLAAITNHHQPSIYPANQYTIITLDSRYALLRKVSKNRVYNKLFILLVIANLFMAPFRRPASISLSLGSIWFLSLLEIVFFLGGRWAGNARSN